MSRVAGKESGKSERACGARKKRGRISAKEKAINERVKRKEPHIETNEKNAIRIIPTAARGKRRGTGKTKRPDGTKCV